jgi:ribose/xylose/arabinose/galactoside ABC-type transport system permease subunit
MRRLLPLVRYVPWLVTLSLLLAMLLSVPAFGRLPYWLELGRQHFAMAALALALTPIILTGGIDLSVGSTSVLVSVVIGALWQRLGWPLEWAFVGGVAAGLLAGLGNGALVTCGVAPLVATLATRELYRGLAFPISSADTVHFSPEAMAFWDGAVPLYALAVLAVATYLVVHHTWVGRLLFALGDNEEAVRFAAQPARSVKLGLYAGAGLVAGLCGAASVLRFGASARGDADQALELQAIACVVLGGVRITGGGGHVLGTVLGIVTLTTLLAGMASVGAAWRDTLMGALLLIVAFGNEAAARVSGRGHR